jgi:hypothetical protein
MTSRNSDIVSNSYEAVKLSQRNTMQSENGPRIGSLNGYVLAPAPVAPVNATDMGLLPKGLYEDYDAVKAGVTLPWSTGPVEGHINRLKMLKRQMFGRAHLDLLSRRFVPAPACGQRPVQSGSVAA